MKKLVTVLTLLMSMLVGITASGQNSRQEFTDSLVKDQNIIMFGSKQSASADSIRSIVESFYYDQFRHFQDPAAPYFMFISRDAVMPTSMLISKVSTVTNFFISCKV